MNKPSREDILRDLSSYVDGWGNPQVYLEAVYKKGRYTPEDFWNPQFDEQWNFIEETAEETQEEVTNEWNDDTNTSTTDEKISKDNANNFEILKSLTDEYEKLCFEKAVLIQENQWWEWLNKNWNKYKQYINDLSAIDKRLSEIEDWPEMHELMQSIKEDWLWDKWYQWTWWVRILLNDIVNKVWTQSITKDNPHYAWKQRDPQSWFIDKIPELVDKYEWQSNNSSNKSEVDKKTSGTKLKDINDAFKSAKMVDNMSFWWDVKSSEYLNRRNDTLAKHLKVNWIETPEEIEEYLNKYPSWKDAPQERKDNTVSILTDKVSKMSHKNETPSKWEFGWKWRKENEDWSKTSPDWTTTVREDWSISFWTDDESSLNDVEWFGWKWWTENKDWSKTSNDWSTTVYKDWSISFWADNKRKWKTFSSLGEKIKFDTDNDSPLNDEDTIYTYQWPVKQWEIKWKDYIEDREEQTPENNKYLWLDEYIRNFDTDASRKKELESMWYKVNKNGFYEKDWVKTRVYKDWRYNPSTEEIAKGWIWTATKNINKNSQDEMDILLQEQGYNWPKDKEWHFIPMNEDTLNWAWDKEETKETSKTKTTLKKGKKDNKKEDKKKVDKVSLSSPTILNLIKGKK